MEERNNSKQVLLSIIGIAVLVIAVVGVSFAFFSYSRTGTSNNVITTGQIFMEFAETHQISLSNQFPMLDSDATTEIVKETGDVEYLDFTVTGYYSASTGGIDYTVYAVAGDNGTSPHVNRMDDSDISVFLKEYPAAYSEAVVSTPTPVSSLDSDGNGKILAVGHINAGTNSQNPQVDTYKLAMFVNDTVRISDTELNVKFTGANTETSAVKYCASALTTKNKTVTVEQQETTIPVYDSGCKIYDNGGTLTVLEEDTDLTNFDQTKLLTVYSTLYYSLKVKVVGNE